MFKAKNLSPNKLSLFTALCLSVPVSVAFYVITKHLYAAAVAFAINMGAGYLLIRFVLDSFIYRKIKLIYKYIYQTKASKKEEMYYKYILPKKSIDERSEEHT